MRARIFSALVLCLLGSFLVGSLAQEKSDAATIRDLESKWIEAYKQRQIATVASLLAVDYVITLEDTSVHGKVGFISYNAGSLRVDVAEASDLRIHMHDNVAVVTGADHEKGVENLTTITTA